MHSSQTKYTHTEDVHNVESPSIIVPELIKIVNPKSVVDIGCGLGTFLKVFKSHGVNEVLGVDGPWVNKELLYKNIAPNEFFESDLEKEIKLDKTYDLVISLEVAEHLSENTADEFVKSLVNAGKVILFSAAIPYQGGQNHINEQWLTYWEEKFLKHKYVVHDIIRPIFWNDPKVFWWYRQNMVLITANDVKLDYSVDANSMRNVVHYKLYESKAIELNKLETLLFGKKSSFLYLKMFLFSLFGYNNVQKIKGLFTSKQ